MSTIHKSGSARYEGLGKDGKGHVSTQSGALDNQPYGFQTRFEDKPGTNPEELIAAAHASCFTMALSFGLAKAGHSDGTLETKAVVSLDKDGDGFSVTKSALTLSATIVRHYGRGFRQGGRRGEGQLPPVEAAQLRNHARAQPQRRLTSAG